MGITRIPVMWFRPTNISAATLPDERLLYQNQSPKLAPVQFLFYSSKFIPLCKKKITCGCSSIFTITHQCYLEYGCLILDLLPSVTASLPPTTNPRWSKLQKHDVGHFLYSEFLIMLWFTSTPPPWLILSQAVKYKHMTYIKTLLRPWICDTVITIWLQLDNFSIKITFIGSINNK
jgi:hypothetical protein